MAEENESLSDMELDAPPKITFDELRHQVLKDPKMARNRLDLLKTLYFYSKDTKKHSRIIKALFWALIVPLLQDKTSNKTALFGLRSLNQLIQNESSHEQIIGAGRTSRVAKTTNVSKMIKKQGSLQNDTTNSPTNAYIEPETIDNKSPQNKSVNPIKILVKKLLETDSTLIMIEASAVISSLSRTEQVIHMLMEDQDLQQIFHQRYINCDSQSQENILLTISATCKFSQYRKILSMDSDFIHVLLSQINSVNVKVAHLTLKICRQMAKEESNLERLQSSQLKLSKKLISSFKWLNSKVTINQMEKKQSGSNTSPEDKNLYEMIFREIAKTFEYIIKFYDLHRRQIQVMLMNNGGLEAKQITDSEISTTENEVIDTIVQLGRQTRDLKTTLHCAKSLSNITEVLNCNPCVASEEAIDMMIDMLKDSKNLKHHIEGCRYFANLSFYKSFRDRLIKKDISNFLLKAIEVHVDDDTIKHSAIALANLSSHKDFLKSSKDPSNMKDTENKTEKWKVKPLIHLLDNTQVQKSSLIQSACITLCNMASKPGLHKHFVHEPEISTIRNCLANPVEKGKDNELTRFMIKLVCNLTKNPEVLPNLLTKGFLEILFDLLSHEREKEMFGSVVTAIAYLSVEKQAQDKIIQNKIFPKILEPLTQIHEVDQKMIIIALTSLLYNKNELQKEFIAHGGLSKLLYFLQQKDKIFYQLSCKCFSLLSESESNLQLMIDQECLNTIIISCLRTKDIDLETLKEITKIFINLILWRKIQPDTIDTICSLSDIGLMVQDTDMNILSVFCLNALSENDATHVFIRQSGLFAEGVNQEEVQADKNQQSIFSRINFLFEVNQMEQTNLSAQEIAKRELLITLITSLYLNLSRNDENRSFLLKLKIFKKLNDLMQNNHKTGLNLLNNTTALCYTNTIFAKLLKYQESRMNCIQEGGYNLFISILGQKQNRHLFLETLDSVKLFLTKREYLVKFRAIPQNIELDKECQELNISFLQVLAILSFEKENHTALKLPAFLENLNKNEIFTNIFKGFEQMGDNQLLKNPMSVHHDDNVSKGGNKQMNVQLSLAVSIILSNLSNEEEYMRVLLGIDTWAKRLKPNQSQDEEAKQTQEIFPAITDQNFDEFFDPQFIEKQPEVKRLTGMLNLLSHEHPFISEQISILLANVSNSPFFRVQYLSDRCIKSLVQILRFHSKNMHTEVSLLAILIAVLNLSAIGDIVNGIENLQFLNSLQEIIKNQALPYVNKSIALLAISNIYTLSKKVDISEETQEFAFHILKDWSYILNEDKENEEVVMNLVYSSLILFYNIILRKSQKDIILKLVNLITTSIMDRFTDIQIVNVILEITVLFTKDKETSNLLFQQPKILAFVFHKLNRASMETNSETMKLAALALSRLASRLDEKHCDLFVAELQQFDNFEYVIKEIAKITARERFDRLLSPNKKKENENSDDEQPVQLKKIEAETLKYLLNVLENITSVKITRDVLDCARLYESVINLITEAMTLENRVSLINIIFNLNFNLTEPTVLSREFMKVMYKTYKDEALSNHNQVKTQRKIMAIMVVASALEQNHHALIKCNFYTQFKRNINENYQQLTDNNEEVEIFGLVNIALNKKYMYLIYQDLKKIHKIAIKNPKIDFKTKVDMLTEISKFVAKLAQRGSNTGNTTSLLAGDEDIEVDKDDSSIIEESLKALIFSVIRLITLLDESNFAMFKYFLAAILDCTANLRSHLNYLIQIDSLMSFLKRVLETHFEFNMLGQDEEVQFDDQVLNFSIKMIVCEIFFNLKFQRDMFKLDNIGDSIQLLIEFSQQVLHMNIEKKTQIVSSTLRLLSQMISTIHTMPGAAEKLLKINAVHFVKEALTLSKDLQSCLNIDALFCLNNLLNIKEIALMPELLNVDTLNNALLIYFAFKDQIDLDECIITFLYSMSKFEEYHGYMKDKFKVIFLLMDQNLALSQRPISADQSKSIEARKQSNLEESRGTTNAESCRQKIFSTIHNLTENEEICKQINYKKFIQVNIHMFKLSNKGAMMTEHIHELALKSLINICRNSSEILEEANLKELFDEIVPLYENFGGLSKQYCLRLVTILTRQWNQQRLEEHLIEILAILSEFIAHCTSDVEIKLVLINLDKISCFKKLLKTLAENQNCGALVANIGKYLRNNLKSEDSKTQTAIEQLIRFCKKLSKQPMAHAHLLQSGIYEVALVYIQGWNRQSKIGIQTGDDESQLKQSLNTIQNVMKMVKHLFEGNLTQAQQNDLVEKVNQNEALIDQADNLLQRYSQNDDIAIKIVNIIICFNSICNKLDSEHVRQWVQNFSKRLIESSKASFQKKHARCWYMEKYIFIIELLVTKNLDKVDRQLTSELLEIYNIDTTFYTKTIWYKLLKILAHLQFLQDVPSPGQLDNILQFIIEAYKRANENLAFLFFMKVILLISKKTDNNTLYRTSIYFKQVLEICITVFGMNLEAKEDPLILEILLYQIDFFKFMMNFGQLHSLLNQKQIVKSLLRMLQIHTETHVVKAISGALQEASKITLFYPDLLNEATLSTILQKILAPNTQLRSLNLLFEVLRNIMLQTKAPIKYLIAVAVLKETENPEIIWAERDENNVVTLLKVIHFNIKILDDIKNSKPDARASEWEGLTINAFRYSMLAMTNVLIKCKSELVFTKKASFLQVLLENAQFEMDPQMSLRVLYLVLDAIKQAQGRDILQQNQIQPLIDFIMANIFKMRNVLESKDSYFYQIPSQSARQDEVINEEVTQLIEQDFTSMVDQKIKTADAHSMAKTPKSKQSHRERPAALFFFEADDFELKKIDAMKISLCLSIKILQKLTKIKKRQACIPIINSQYSNELNKFLTSFIEFKDLKTIKQVKQTIKIFRDCAECTNLHGQLLQNDVVTSLVRVVDKAMNGLGAASTVKIRRDLVIPILKTFIFLCVTPEFNWHLTKYNALDLLNSLRERDDEKIREIAREVCEKVVDHIDDSLLADQDFKILIQQMQNENPTKQLKSLQQIEASVIQKQVNLGKMMENKELAMLLHIAGQESRYDPDPDLQVKSKSSILKIVNFVYSNKYLQMKNNPELNYRDGLDQLLSEPKHAKKRVEQNQNAQKEQLKVASAIELEETFQILLSLIKQLEFTFKEASLAVRQQLKNYIAELIFSYSQSNFKNVECIVQYVLPIICLILDPISALDGKEGLSSTAFKLLIQSVTTICGSTHLYPLIAEQFDISLVISKLLENEKCFLRKEQPKQEPHSAVFAAVTSFAQQDTKTVASQISFQELIVSLEHICKIIYFQHPKLSKGTENLIHILIQSKQKEFVKLGIFCMYCISLALQEKNLSVNLSFFLDDQVMSTLFKFIRDKKAIQQPQGKKSLTQVQLAELKSDIDEVKDEMSESFDASKMRIIALQILVILLEYINTISSDKLAQQSESRDLKDSKAKLNHKILLQYNLFSYLIGRCKEKSKAKDLSREELKLSSQQKESERDEAKLTARCFASIPIALLVQQNLPVLENDFPKSDIEKSHQQETVESYFNAIAYILQTSDNSQQIYFAIYAVMNFMNSVELKTASPQTKDAVHRAMQPYMFKLQDMDYSMMYAALLRANLISLIMMQPQKVTADEDIIRASLKFLITMVFKQSNQSILLGSKKNAETHQLFAKLGLSLDDEKKNFAEILRSFVAKLNQFDMSRLYQGGYAHYIHLVSQIVQSASPNVKQTVLPSDTVLLDLCKQFKQIESMSEASLDQVVSHVEGKPKKMMIFKFFFFNYLIQLNMADLSPVLARNPNDLCDLISSLLLVIHALKSKRTNSDIDQALKPYKQWQSTKEKGETQEEAAQVSSCDDSQSTTLSIIKMTLFNLNNLVHLGLSISQDPQDAAKTATAPIECTASQLDGLASLLLDYEDIGDIVEPVYLLLTKLMALARENSEHTTILAMESSRTLLSQGIKHATVYQCTEAYSVLRTLIGVSERFKNKPEMHQRLLKIAPAGYKMNTMLQQPIGLAFAQDFSF